MKPTVLIYLHGFLSSPQSVKAQQTVSYVTANYPHIELEVPELANYPDQAMAKLEQLITAHPNKNLRFIGSSMGGFLSTHLVEKYGGKAVLINPAVKPFELFADYLGDHVNPYTNVAFTLLTEHVQQLIELDTLNLRQPQSYWVLLQKEDQTLDYRQAEEKFQKSKLTIQAGGDHSFQGFQNFLPEICHFLFDE